jgi:hypothetical protein
VAEIAERPLYRVTCGDVGIKPEEVEKYLESVLHLARSWPAVQKQDKPVSFAGDQIGGVFGLDVVGHHSREASLSSHMR